MKKYSSVYPLIFGIIFLLIGVGGRQIEITVFLGVIPISISILLLVQEHKQKKRGVITDTEKLNREYETRKKSTETYAQEDKSPYAGLMTSQYVALFLEEGKIEYKNAYIKKLISIGFNKADAEKMFLFELEVVKKYEKKYLCHPQFTQMWFIGLQHPFFQQYPKEKEDILKEKYFTVSELCKLIDEAEWHYWNSHERNISDEVWGEIHQWHLKGPGAEFAIKYFEMIEAETGIPEESIAALSSEQGQHLSRYKWR